MQFSLRVICNHSIIEIVNPRVATLVNYLDLSDGYTFSPYWKDSECVIIEINTKIDKPNYCKIQQYIQLISGTENISESGSTGEWECAHFVSLDEMHSNKNVVFVVCNIFEG